MDASTQQTAFSSSTYWLDNGKHEQYILSDGSWSHFLVLFFVMDRMSVLVYQSLNSVFSESSGVGTPLHPPLTIYLNNSILQVSSFLESLNLEG